MPSEVYESVKSWRLFIRCMYEALEDSEVDRLSDIPGGATKCTESVEVYCYYHTNQSAQVCLDV
jgi:hypothetical protein